jgi:hypothetical protein
VEEWPAVGGLVMLLSRLQILLEARLARLNTWSLPNQMLQNLGRPANEKREQTSRVLRTRSSSRWIRIVEVLSNLICFCSRDISQHFSLFFFHYSLLDGSFMSIIKCSSDGPKESGPACSMLQVTMDISSASIMFPLLWCISVKPKCPQSSGILKSSLR